MSSLTRNSFLRHTAPHKGLKWLGSRTRDEELVCTHCRDAVLAWQPFGCGPIHRLALSPRSETADRVVISAHHLAARGTAIPGRAKLGDRRRVANRWQTFWSTMGLKMQGKAPIPPRRLLPRDTARFSLSPKPCLHCAILIALTSVCVFHLAE